MFQMLTPLDCLRTTATMLPHRSKDVLSPAEKRALPKVMKRLGDIDKMTEKELVALLGAARPSPLCCGNCHRKVRAVVRFEDDGSAVWVCRRCMQKALVLSDEE